MVPCAARRLDVAQQRPKTARFGERAKFGAISAATIAALLGSACSGDDGLPPYWWWDAGSDAAGGSGGASTGHGGSATGGGGSGGNTGGTSGGSGSGGTSGGAAGTSVDAGGAAGADGSRDGAGGGSGADASSDGSGGMNGDAAGDTGAADRHDAADVDGASEAGSDITSDIGMGDTAPPDGNTARPPCMQSPNQVVVLGDSYVNWISHTFPADLARESGVTYRMYAVGGTAMASGGLGLIPPQFDQALAADPNIIAVVMDGGGNDILVPDTVQFPQGGECKQSLVSPTIPDCQKIVQKALDKSVELMNLAADKGVKDVVYFFYPHVPDGTLVGGAHPNVILDYALPKVKATCDEAYARTGGRMRCHFLDLIPVFDGHPDWFAFTDIHPTPAGSAAMAKEIWAIMKNNCIAQPASSGCCAP
jgi:hypothetical protein